jgi:hypothetical protein
VLQVLNIGWDVGMRQIVHAFVKTCMIRNFDTFGGDVVPENVLESCGEKTEENTLASVVPEFAFTKAGGSNPNTTTKRAEGRKIRLDSMTAFKRRESVSFAGESILNTDVLMKSIWPEMGIEARAGKHGTKCVTNSLVRTFDGSILV